MKFIRKRQIPRSRYFQGAFLGYSPRLRTDSRHWFHEENLSSRSFPLLRPRAQRRKLLDLPLTALGSMDGICYLSNNVLYYGDRQMKLPLSEGEKELLSFGAYVLVLPDMVAVNTVEDTFAFCQISREFQLPLGICWCHEDGTPLEAVVEDPEPPENLQQFWVDSKEDAYILKKFSEDLGKWLPVEPTYVRLWGESIGAEFPKDSRILVEKCPYLAPIVGTGLLRVYDSGRDYLVLEGSITGTRVETPLLQFTLTSPVPKMDHVIAHENRLWGCRYGTDHHGNFVNEIYASALGRMDQWYSFRGLASDSYTLSLGAEGPFTGAAVVGGCPVFFKEQSIHKISGSRPSTYQIRSTACMGVAPESHKSLALLNDTAIYLGRDGFYAYDGSFPVKISGDLDGQAYTKGIGGVLGQVYYGAVLENGKDPVLMTYDGVNGLWHRETGLRPKEFLSTKGILYYRTEAAGLYAIGTEEGEPAEPPVIWEGVTPMFREEKQGKGYFTGLSLRLTLPLGSTVSLFGEYDSTGAWEPLGTVGGKVRGSKEIFFPIRRCDHFRLKLQGRGDALIHTLTITMEG